MRITNVKVAGDFHELRAAVYSATAYLNRRILLQRFLYILSLIPALMFGRWGMKTEGFWISSLAAVVVFVMLLALVKMFVYVEQLIPVTVQDRILGKVPNVLLLRRDTRSFLRESKDCTTDHWFKEFIRREVSGHVVSERQLWDVILHNKPCYIELIVEDGKGRLTVSTDDDSFDVNIDSLQLSKENNQDSSDLTLYLSLNKVIVICNANRLEPLHIKYL